MTHRTKLMLSLCLGLSLTGPTVYGGKADRKMPAEKPLPAVPERVATPIDPKLQAQAADVLKASLNSANPITRAHAIEASQKVYHEKAADALIRALDDREPVVRFAATVALGDLKLTSAHDEVLKHLNDADAGVRVGVRYALHMMGDVRFSHELENYAKDPEKGVRGNVALVLGRTGTPSAVKILSVLEKDRQATVRMQAAEALWKLGDESGLQTLVAGTISGYADDVLFCTLALAGPRVQSVRGHLQDALTGDYPEVQLAAARALGQLGNEGGFGVALAGAQSKDRGQRYLAAMALGDIGRPDGQEALKNVLQEKDSAGFPTSEDIHLAAACALLQIGNAK